MSRAKMGNIRKVGGKRRVFRENLKTWMGNRPIGVVSRSLGMEYKRLHRWLTEGIERPDHRSFASVLKLAEAMGLSDWSRLWEEGLFQPMRIDEALNSCIDKFLDLSKDEAWVPALIEAVNQVWNQREQGQAETGCAVGKREAKMGHQ